MSVGLRVASEVSPGRRLRVITAGSLFDGHDVAINIMRRVHHSS